VLEYTPYKLGDSMEKIYKLIYKDDKKTQIISEGPIELIDKYTMKYLDQEDLLFDLITNPNNHLEIRNESKVILLPINSNLEKEKEKVLYKKHLIIFKNIMENNVFINYLDEFELQEEQKLNKIIDEIIDHPDNLVQLENIYSIIRQILKIYKKVYKKLNLQSSTKIYENYIKEQSKIYDNQLDLITGKPYVKK